MVARGPGDVGCAHCTKIGANQTCQVCTHLVCDACAADWTTCSEPAGREVRLGMTARVKDVDPRGRFAIVTHALKGPRLFDLRLLKWNGGLPHTRVMTAVMPHFPSRLTSTGLYARAELIVEDEAVVFRGVRWSRLSGAGTTLVNAESMQRCSMVSTTDELAYVSSSERVVVMTPLITTSADAYLTTIEVRTHTYDPLPRKVIHAMHLTNDILVTASWREVVIDRIVDGKLERLARLDTAHDANVTWVSLAGNVLAYVTQGVIEVRRVDASFNIGGVVARHRRRFHCGALSVDGRYLALGIGDKVVLHDLERDEETTYDEHSDAVSFVKFAADDHLLITADDDNRVVLRPRTEHGYARAIIAARLQD